MGAIPIIWIVFAQAAGPALGGFLLAQLPFRASTATIVFLGRAKRGDRYCEVVQRDQGIWVYSTRQRRQGCVCAHLCRGESGPEQPQRGRQGALRREGQPRQIVRGKSKSSLNRGPFSVGLMNGDGGQVWVPN